MTRTNTSRCPKQRRIAELEAALKEALEECDTCDVLRAQIKGTLLLVQILLYAQQEKIKSLQEELNETADAYKDLYDMVEHGST